MSYLPNLNVRVQYLDTYDPSWPRLGYAKPGDAGFDLRATKSFVLYPGDRVVVPAGFKIEIPAGYELQIRPRSGLSLNSDLLVVNAPGTIDSGYRGEVGVILGHFGLNGRYEQTAHHIKRGDRIAQAVLAPVTTALFVEAEELAVSDRGEGGFGSTGVA